MWAAAKSVISSGWHRFMDRDWAIIPGFTEFVQILSSLVRWFRTSLVSSKPHFSDVSQPQGTGTSSKPHNLLQEFWTRRRLPNMLPCASRRGRDGTEFYRFPLSQASQSGTVSG